MNSLHEVIEMDAVLLQERTALVEHVHEHGLAASDRSPEVNSSRDG